MFYFFLLEVESSGWPSGAKSDTAQKELFIKQYAEREQITVDGERVCLNRGLRLIS